MKTVKTIMFHPHGDRTYINGRFVCANTNSEYQAYILIGRGICHTNSSYTPHDAGNEIIELAERIKSERAIMAMES